MNAEIIAPRRVAEKYKNAVLCGCQVVGLGVPGLSLPTSISKFKDEGMLYRLCHKTPS